MATDMSYLPAVTVTDKLRFAASKGQLSVVHQLVKEGASFIPDKVRIACSLIIIYYKYNNINNNTYIALNYILYWLLQLLYNKFLDCCDNIHTITNSWIGATYNEDIYNIL